jgi:ketosteroid isomerase-like protein
MLALLPALLLAAGPASPDARPLRDADLALGKAVSARDRSAFEALIDEEAIFGNGLDEGRAAVGKTWARFMKKDGPRLTWTPEAAVLAASGDLGYTVGRSRFEPRDRGSGKSEVQEGRYLTVWRRGADGRFRALFDLTLDPELARNPSLVRTPWRVVTSTAGDLEASVGTWTRPGGEAPTAGAYLLVRARGTSGALEEAVSTAVPRRPPAADAGPATPAAPTPGARKP